MSSRRPKVTGGRRLYASALQKLWRHQVPNAAEARELRRNRLAGGSYPVPQATDAKQAVGFALIDPRLA